MRAAHSPLPDTADRNDLASEVRQEAPPPSALPFDWQVLLMRYLPQPVGSTHVIKRLAPR